MSEQTNISPALESKIMKLHSRMEETVAQGRRRMTMTALAMGALLLAGAVYLRYLYSTVKEFAEARTIVEMVAAQVEPQLNAEASRFGDTLQAQMPAVLDQAEKLVLSAPPKIAREVEGYAASFVDKQLVSLESQAYDVVSRTLQGAMDKAQSEGVDLKDEKQLDALIADAAPLMREKLQQTIEKLYEEYTAGADSLVAHIEKLVVEGAQNKLSPLEKSQRETLLAGLAIIKKIESDPSRSPLQKVLEVR
jgi:hypothetical protein